MAFLPGVPTARPSPSIAHEGSLAFRFRQRLFKPLTWDLNNKDEDIALTAQASRKKASFQASIAEFLLINRLRARRRAAPSAEVLERAARIVYITCQNWFAPVDKSGGNHRISL